MAEQIRLEGVKDLEDALKKFDENAYKKLNKAINKAAGRIRSHARGYIPVGTPPGLSNWSREATGSTLNGRHFPTFNAAEMRSQLRTGRKRSGRSRNGWGSVVYVEQRSAAGNIFEKAGVVAFSGRESRSMNPMASLDFKGKLQDFYSIGRGRGRALIRAGVEDAGQAKSEINRARYEAELQLQADFNREAAAHG